MLKMSDKNLKLLKSYYPEIRYLFYNVRQKDRQKYIMYSDEGFVNMLVQVALNLIYCRKNNLKLTPAQIRRLKGHKTAIKSLLAAKNLSKKKQLLSPVLVNALLSVFIDVIHRMELPL